MPAEIPLLVASNNPKFPTRITQLGLQGYFGCYNPLSRGERADPNEAGTR